MESSMTKTKKTKRRRFSAEFKAEVIRLVLDGGHSIPNVCRDHELGESTVYQWVKQARIDRGQGDPGALTSAEKAELTQLRKEVRELKRERDFFERATVYFAREKR